MNLAVYLEGYVLYLSNISKCLLREILCLLREIVLHVLRNSKFPVTLTRTVLLKLFCTRWLQIYNSKEYNQPYYISICHCKKIRYFYVVSG